jgi:transcriptional regulator with XRE-family HTH domain
MPRTTTGRAIKTAPPPETPLWARRMAMSFEFAGIVDKKGNPDKSRIGSLLHVGAKTVESWITGRTQPRFETLMQIRKITGISLDWILAEASVASAPQQYDSASGAKFPKK